MSPKVGGQKKHFKDTLKGSLKDSSIDPDVWENVVLTEPPGTMQFIVVLHLRRASKQAIQ